MLNPEDIIKDTFLAYGRRKKAQPPQTQDTKNIPDGSPGKTTKTPTTDAPPKSIEPPTDVKGTISTSVLYSQGTRDDTVLDYNGGLSTNPSAGSIYILEEISRINGSATSDSLRPKDRIIITTTSKRDAGVSYTETLSTEAGHGEETESQTARAPNRRRKRRRFFRRRASGPNEDRRRTSWLPCTCPQYKVSNELASKWNAQAIFFAKVMLVKIIQLMVINLVVFFSGYYRKDTIEFFEDAHDWIYLTYALFLALLTCIRVLLTYKARWPRLTAFILMIPLTAIIAFICACITTVYNSVLIPMVTGSVLITYVAITVVPYLLEKFVLHRTINVLSAGITLAASIALISLKELEEKENVTYWEFVSHIWFPAVILSEIIVLVSIFEMQRLLFGLCFNVSTKRWHIAALYL